MTVCHVVTERSVWSFVQRVSEVLVESETYTSLCFSDVGVPHLFLLTEFTCDFVYYICGVTSATQTVLASCTFSAPAGTGGRVQG